jgi:hypothetical protein
MAAALGAHVGELVLHARPDAAQVDGLDAFEDVELLVCGVCRRDHDAGVVERHVETAQLTDRGARRGRKSRS